MTSNPGENVVSDENAAEIGRNLLVTLTCENCGAVAELPKVGKEGEFVSIIPANGWQLYPRCLCPRCDQ